MTDEEISNYNIKQICSTVIKYPFDLVTKIYFLSDFINSIFCKTEKYDYKRFLGSWINVEGSGFQMFLDNIKITYYTHKYQKDKDVIIIDFILKDIDGIEVKDFLSVDYIFYRNSCENCTFFEIVYNYDLGGNYVALIDALEKNSFNKYEQDVMRRTKSLFKEYIKKGHQEMNSLIYSQRVNFGYKKVLNYYLNWILMCKDVLPNTEIKCLENKNGICYKYSVKLLNNKVCIYTLKNVNIEKEHIIIDYEISNVFQKPQLIQNIKIVIYKIDNDICLVQYNVNIYDIISQKSIETLEFFFEYLLKRLNNQIDILESVKK